MPSASSCQVRRNRIRFWSAVAVTVALLATAAVFLARPDAVTTVTGVAVESARDVNGVANAPVTYSVANAQRTEMVRTEATAGTAVTFPVNAEGMPASGSWSIALLLGVMTALLLGSTALLGFLFSQEDYEIRLFEARLRESQLPSETHQSVSTVTH